MRLRHNPNALSELKKYEDIVIFKPENHKGKWKDFFDNANPIYVELGMGRGKFITTHAVNNPDINYIGIEKKNEVILDSLNRITNAIPDNIAFIPVNIMYLTDVFEAGEISKIYLNFSDPWPKARHAKRRLTHRLFLDIYKVILSKDGIIEFKTDNRNLFDFSILEFEESGFEVYDITNDLKSLEDPNNVTTEYEEKFMRKGFKINRLRARLR